MVSKSKAVLVQVHWISREEGGRSSLPAGHQYSTVSRFEEDTDTWLQKAWSVVLDFDRPPLEQGNPSVARAKFLSDSAPIERLMPGRTFELYEGRKKVAVVRIISE